MKHSYTVLGLTACAVLAASGCSAGAKPRLSGRDVYVFLDLSGSIDPPQRARWERSAEALGMSLGDDSSISVYAIHDRTMDEARLFGAEVPVPVADGTRTSAELQKAARNAARKGAAAAIKSALENGGQAASTDIFSAIDRVGHPHANRRLQIYFYSDMLNSTPDFDMEKPGSLQRAGFSDRVQRLAKRHAWRPEQLAGAEVFCLLNSVESGARGPAVDRLTQRAFYGVLFESLGAKLVSYDTDIPNLAAQAEGER